MRCALTIVLLICAIAVAQTAVGAVYYVDGDALASGTGTLASPWKHLSDIGNLAAGDSILLKRGCQWREQLTLTVSGLPGSPIVIDAYGSGDLPLINGADVVTDWAVGSGAVYTSLLDWSDPIAGVVLVDGRPLTFLPWQGDLDATFAAAAPGSYCSDPVAGQVHVWLAQNDAPYGHWIEAARRDYGITADGVSDVTIRNVHIVGARRHGIFLANGNNWLIEGCLIENIGGKYEEAINAYLGNGIEFGSATRDCTVRSCVLRNIFDSGLTAQAWSSSAIANISFLESTVEFCGLAGIELAVLASDASLTNTRIESVTITGSGKGWGGSRGGHGIIVYTSYGFVGAGIAKTEIESCTITACAGDGIKADRYAGHLWAARCRISGNDGNGMTVVDYENPTTTSLTLLYSELYKNRGHGLHFEVWYGDGNRIDNNTFYFNGSAAEEKHDLYMAGYADDKLKLIRNNVFYADSEIPLYFEWGYAWDCSVDYNAYHGNSQGIMVHHNDIDYAAETFQDYIQLGQDRHSIILKSSPFVKPVKGDFTPIVGAPIINAGIATGQVCDILENEVPLDGATDIGAVEWVRGSRQIRSLAAPISLLLEM